MTKKHFVEVAKVINHHYTDKKTTDEQSYRIKQIAEDLACTFSHFNPYFDEEKFLVSCGIEK